MSLKPEVVDALVAAGVTAEQLAAAVKADQWADETRRTSKRLKDAERQRRYRECHAMSRVTDCDNADDPSPKTFNGNLSTLEVTQTPTKENPPKGGQKKGADWPTDGFAQLWHLYPNKVGKADAERSFGKVRRSGLTTFEHLMDGLKAYVAKTDDRPWCNPATWLNQGRWDDAPALPLTTGPPSEDPAVKQARIIALAERRKAENPRYN